MKTAAKTKPLIDKAQLGQVVLVFQGGGALGAYQAGVYQALQEAGVEPDWLIGTSIGAINAALIAGNAPADRLGRLLEFWSRMTHSRAVQVAGMIPGVGAHLVGRAGPGGRGGGDGGKRRGERRRSQQFEGFHGFLSSGCPMTRR